MPKSTNQPLNRVLEAYSLDKLSRPVNLRRLAKGWGVSSVDTQAIDSDAMLLPSPDGYKIVLKSVTSHSESSRQRFSFAHELGHLLLRNIGYEKRSGLSARQQARNYYDEEEKLCDQIAAEILMPRIAFTKDASRVGWSLLGLRQLLRLYEASVEATARRMVSLMPEACVMAIWKPSENPSELPKLVRYFASDIRYGVPNQVRLPRQRLWLVNRASNSHEVESGIAPLVDEKRPAAAPPDVPTEAWAWGIAEYRRVMMYYYPERQPTEEMVALSRATWKAI
jgi:hypothetical protein